MPPEEWKCPQDVLVPFPPGVPALLEWDSQGDALQVPSGIGDHGGHRGWGTVPVSLQWDLAGHRALSPACPSCLGGVGQREWQRGAGHSVPRGCHLPLGGTGIGVALPTHCCGPGRAPWHGCSLDITPWHHPWLRCSSPVPLWDKIPEPHPEQQFLGNVPEKYPWATSGQCPWAVSLRNIPGQCP